MNAKKPKPCSVATTDEKSDMREVKNLLQQLNSRIEKLEKQNEERCASNMQQQEPGKSSFDRSGPYNVRGYRGQRYFRGSLMRDRQFPQTRGRGDFRPNRPTGTNTFKPNLPSIECFCCGRQGHFVRDCPLNG